MSLQIGVNSEPPLIEVKKLFPIPEIICGVNEDKDKIRDNIEKNINFEKMYNERKKSQL